MESVKIYLKTPEDAENFVQTMRQFEGEYDLTLGSVTVDAKSILGVFALGIGKEFELLFGTNHDVTKKVYHLLSLYKVFLSCLLPYKLYPPYQKVH